MWLSEAPLNDMNGVERGDLKECGGPERKKNHVPLSLHEEHGRSLCAKGGHDASDMRMKDREYLSHLSLLRRHGAQLIVFLARFAGALRRSILEEASATDSGDRGRVLVDGVSEEGRPSEVSLGERPDMLEDEGDDGMGMSGAARGGGGRGRGVKGQLICIVGEGETHLASPVPVGSSYNDRIVSIIYRLTALSAPARVAPNYNYYSSQISLESLNLDSDTFRMNNRGYNCKPERLAVFDPLRPIVAQPERKHRTCHHLRYLMWTSTTERPTALLADRDYLSKYLLGNQRPRDTAVFRTLLRRTGMICL